MDEALPNVLESDLSFSPNEEPCTPSIVFHTFEQALKVVGSFGRYQILFILTVQVMIVTVCGNVVFMPYATYEPNVTCQTNDSMLVLNYSDKNPFCQMYENGNCSKVMWDAPFYTIIQEWNLICEDDDKAQLINSITILGTLFAAFIGSFSDIFGRKRTFLISYCALLVVSVSGTFAPFWQLFAATRFFVSMLVAASFTMNFVWAMEMTDQKHNLLINLSSLWHFGFMITALIGYLTGSWKTFLIVINAIGAPLLVIFGFCFVESPRWLIQKGKLDKAAELMNKIAKHNRTLHRVEISSDNLSGIPQNEAPLNGCSNIITLLKTRVLLKYFVIISLVLFATSSTTSTFIFESTVTPGNPFFKFFLYGLLRLATPVFIYTANRKISWFGRRHIVIAPLTTVIILYGIAIIIGCISPGSKFVFLFILFGAIACNMLWTGIGQYQMELFPTFMRNTAASVSFMIDPIASAIIPQLVYREQIWNWPGLPLMWSELWAILALIVVYFYLPETKGRSLPDTIECVQNISDEHKQVRNWEDTWIYWNTLCCYGENVEPIENVDNDDVISQEQIEINQHDVSVPI